MRLERKGFWLVLYGLRVVYNLTRRTVVRRVLDSNENKGATPRIGLPTPLAAYFTVGGTTASESELAPSARPSSLGRLSLNVATTPPINERRRADAIVHKPVTGRFVYSGRS